MANEKLTKDAATVLRNKGIHAILLCIEAELGDLRKKVSR